MMTKFSVVIPSYNHAPFITEAINSVLVQSEPDLELIVIDDESTDSTLDVLNRSTDPRLRVIRQSHLGAHAAINHGLRLAQGEYLAILNSDDAYHPRRLEKALSALEAEPQVGLLGSYIEIMDDEGRAMGVKHGYQDCEPWLLAAPERSFRAGSDLHAALLTENYYATTSNFVFSQRWYHKAGEFLPLRYTHDWDYALRLASLAPLILLPEPLVRYRIHANNTIRENQAAMIFEICWCLAVHLPGQVEILSSRSGTNPEAMIDQLLHSIYTYGCDQVMSAMIVEGLHSNPQRALCRLEPRDPVRLRYLEYIQNRLAGGASAPPIEKPKLIGMLRRILARRNSLLPRLWAAMKRAIDMPDGGG